MDNQEKNKIGFLDKAWAWVVNVAGMLFIIAGIGIFGFQVFGYLKYGEWFEIPLFDLASTLFSEKALHWLHNPTSWLGLHRIVNGALQLIPLSLFAVVVGGYMATYRAEGNA